MRAGTAFILLISNLSCILMAYQCYVWAAPHNTFTTILAGTAFRVTLLVAAFMGLHKFMPKNDLITRIHDKDTIEEGGWPAFFRGVLDMMHLVILESLCLFYFIHSSLPNNETPPVVETTNYKDESNLHWYLFQFLSFIPISLAWDLLFDFQHYWLHRAAHMNKTVYKYIHLDHHEHEKPGAMSTFHMSTLDFAITNIVPQVVTFWTLSHFFGISFSVFQMQLNASFKNAHEIGGHAGLGGEWAFSFMQFPFLGLLTDFMSATSHDHDLHHSRFTVNYAKRFKLWDVLFGTYDSLDAIVKKRFDRRLSIRVMTLGLRKSLSSFLVRPGQLRSTVDTPIKLDERREAQLRKRAVQGNKVSRKTTAL